MLAGALPGAGSRASADWVADASMDLSAGPLVRQCETPHRAAPCVDVAHTTAEHSWESHCWVEGRDWCPGHKRFHFFLGPNG